MGAAKEGYIITADTASLRKLKCDEIWLITRAGKDIPGTIRVQELSPGPILFNKYLKEWRGQDPEEWWPKYEEEFIKQLQKEETLSTLRQLWKMIKTGKVVALVCYCKDSRYCHRSLVGKFLNNVGIVVEEANYKSTSATSVFEQMSMF